MNKLIQTFAFAAATTGTLTVAAIPATAQHFSEPHVMTAPIVVHNGTTAALNTQPIPPGHPLNLVHAIPAGGPAFLRSLEAHALNTQPIPPGHGRYTTEIGGRRDKHHHGKKRGPTKAWDLSKGQTS